MSVKKSLIELLREIDTDVVELICNGDVEWARAHLGIIGLVRVKNACDATTLDLEIERLVKNAYSALDGLSDEVLALEDLWNTALCIVIPWMRGGAAPPVEVKDVVTKWTKDTSGTRKIVLWSDQELRTFLGPLDASGTWMMPKGDPLHEELSAIARDSTEFDALELMFKRRLTEEDIHQIVDTLGRADVS